MIQENIFNKAAFEAHVSNTTRENNTNIGTILFAVGLLALATMIFVAHSKKNSDKEEG